MRCHRGLMGCHSSMNQLFMWMFSSLQIPLKEVANRIIDSMAKQKWISKSSPSPHQWCGLELVHFSFSSTDCLSIIILPSQIFEGRLNEVVPINYGPVSDTCLSPISISPAPSLTQIVYILYTRRSQTLVSSLKVKIKLPIKIASSM